MIKKNKNILKWGLLSLISLFGTSFIGSNTICCGSSTSKDGQPVEPTGNVAITFKDHDQNTIVVKDCSLPFDNDGKVNYYLNNYYDIDYDKSFYCIGNDITRQLLYKDDFSKNVYIHSLSSAIFIKKELLKEVINNDSRYQLIEFHLVCKPNENFNSLSINLVNEQGKNSYALGIDYYPEDGILKKLFFYNSLTQNNIYLDKNGNYLMKMVTAFGQKDHIISNDSFSSFYQIVKYGNNYLGDDVKIYLDAELDQDIIVDEITDDPDDRKYGKEHNYSIFTINFGAHLPYGNVYLTIYDEIITMNKDYWYTFVDDEGNTIFLEDTSVESGIITQPIVGYKAIDNQRVTISLPRDTFNEVVNVGSKIISIGDDFFTNCPLLENINFADFSNISNFGDNFLKNNSNLKKITCLNTSLPEVITFSHDNLRIGKDFLYGCEAFNQKIIFCTNIKLEYIDENFLYGCKSLDSNIIFENSSYYEQRYNTGCVNHNGFLHNCDNFVHAKIFFRLQKRRLIENMFYIVRRESSPIAFGSDSKNALSYTKGIIVLCSNDDVKNALQDTFPLCDGYNQEPSHNYRRLKVRVEEPGDDEDE